jgi:hypothetical protein
MIEARFFGGLDIPDSAALLGISRPPYCRDWRVAKAWLRTATHKCLKDAEYSMDSARWQQIQNLFHETVDRPADERPRF